MRFVNHFEKSILCCIITGMKSFFKSFVLCALLLLFAVPVFASELTDDLLDIAKNYYNEGNKSKTLEYVNQILAIEENNLDAIELKIKLNPPKISKPYPDIFKPLVFDVPYVKNSNQLVDGAY